MLRRLLFSLTTIVVVAALVSLPELANPAVGVPTVTRAGTVFPTTLTAGGQTRFCGSGFAPGAAVDVLVGQEAATGVTASATGGFCLDLHARSWAQGPSDLLAVGKTPDGRLLKVTGVAAITGTDAVPATPSARFGPLASSSKPIVLQLWGGAAVLALLVGVVGIGAQRRRIRAAQLSSAAATECASGA